MKILLKSTFILAFVFMGVFVNAQIYQSKLATISFFSKTPVEDIEAHNTKVSSLLNTAKGDIVFTVVMRGFDFEKDLMEEHFNEKYLESDKYKDASYSGKIVEKIDYTKNGVYQVTTKGKLKIHGVTKEITEKGTITIKDGAINVKCNMDVKLKDYNIEVPSLVVTNISEVIDVDIVADYIPFVKK